VSIRRHNAPKLHPWQRMELPKQLRVPREDQVPRCSLCSHSLATLAAPESDALVKDGQQHQLGRPKKDVGGLGWWCDVLGQHSYAVADLAAKGSIGQTWTNCAKQ